MLVLTRQIGQEIVIDGSIRVTITSKANETFGAGSHGGHDDLVLAVALASRNTAPRST